MMLNFFKNLKEQFQAKPPPEINLTGYDHDEAVLFFQNYREPARHLMEEVTDRDTGQIRPMELVANFPDGQIIDATLQFIAHDPADGRHTARVVSPLHLTRMLEVAFPKPEPPEEEQQQPLVERRKHYRLQRVLGVISPKLPGFKAVTHEISVVGVRIDSDAAVESEAVIPFKLDLDDAEIDPMPIQARVVWCQPKPKHPRVHWVGMEFVSIDPEQLEILAAFIEERKDAGWSAAYEL